MFSAYVFVNLRSNGTLQLPVDRAAPPDPDRERRRRRAAGARDHPGLRDRCSACCSSCVAYRPLLRAAPLTKVCASVGDHAAARGDRGAELRHHLARRRPGPAEHPDHDRGRLRARRTGCCCSASWSSSRSRCSPVYRFTRFGLATRASAENEAGAALIGISRDRDRGPELGARQPARRPVRHPHHPDLVARPDLVHALHRPGARCGARRPVRSPSPGPRLPGIALGIFQSLIVLLQSQIAWLPRQGLGDGLPFLLILIAMTHQRAAARGAGRPGHDAEPVARADRPARSPPPCLLRRRRRRARRAAGLAAGRLHRRRSSRSASASRSSCSPATSARCRSPSSPSSGSARSSCPSSGRPPGCRSPSRSCSRRSPRCRSG